MMNAIHQADREGRVCYLESSNDINPIIYRKMGFEIVKHIYLNRAAKKIRMDIMVREPGRTGRSVDHQDLNPSPAESLALS